MHLMSFWPLGQPMKLCAEKRLWYGHAVLTFQLANEIVCKNKTLQVMLFWPFLQPMKYLPEKCCCRSCCFDLSWSLETVCWKRFGVTSWTYFSTSLFDWTFMMWMMWRRYMSGLHCFKYGNKKIKTNLNEPMCEPLIKNKVLLYSSRQFISIIWNLDTLWTQKQGSNVNEISLTCWKPCLKILTYEVILMDNLLNDAFGQKRKVVFLVVQPISIFIADHNFFYCGKSTYECLNGSIDDGSDIADICIYLMQQFFLFSKSPGHGTIENSLHLYRIISIDHLTKVKQLSKHKLNNLCMICLDLGYVSLVLIPPYYANYCAHPITESLCTLTSPH